jgi:hypothetical protein
MHVVVPDETGVPDRLVGDQRGKNQHEARKPVSAPKANLGPGPPRHLRDDEIGPRGRRLPAIGWFL